MRMGLLLLIVFGAGLGLGALLFGGSTSSPTAEPHHEHLDRAGGSPPEKAQQGSPAAAGPPSGPQLAARGETPTRRLEMDGERHQWIRGLLNDAYAAFRRGAEPGLPEDLQDSAARSALESIEGHLKTYGAWMSGYVDAGRTFGTLGDTPRIEVSARGHRSVRIDRRWTGDTKRNPYLDVVDQTLTSLQASPTGNRTTLYLDVGVPPLDRAVVIDRIEIEAVLGTPIANTNSPAALRKATGRLALRFAGHDLLTREGVGAETLTGHLVGRAVLRAPHGLPDIRLELQRAGVRFIATGRYVTLRESRDLRDQDWRFVTAEDDGLLDDQPTILQIIANHGGGNPHKLFLDGEHGAYVDASSPEALWDDALDLTALRASRSWSQNAGVVPEGKVWRITAIDWRCRLGQPGGNNCYARILGPTGVLVERVAADGATHEGRWDGEVDIRAGEERRLSVDCAMYAMVEAIMHGHLVDAAETEAAR